jgi:hypothetical protein
MPSLSILKMVKNIKFIVILSMDVILDISDYFTKFMYYKLISSYVYIIEVKGEEVVEEEKKVEVKTEEEDISVLRKKDIEVILNEIIKS